MGISHHIDNTDSGNNLNNTEITRQKIAITIKRMIKITSRNIVLIRGEITEAATSPILFPLCLSDNIIDPKSCTAPIKMHPKTTHISAGTHPHIMPIAGPTIGPVPAIEV